MKIKLNKEYTESWNVENIKEAMKEFKVSYSDTDLAIAFRDQTGIITGSGMDVIRVNVEAFDAGWAFGNKASFKVDILLESYTSYVRYHFYCDSNLSIDLRDGLYEAKKFKMI